MENPKTAIKRAAPAGFRRRSAGQDRVHILMLLPYGLFFLVFYILPVVIAIFFAFTHYDMLDTPRFLGFSNFTRLFLDDDLFLISLKNTLMFALITGPVSYMACLFFAWMINDLSRRTRAVVMLLFYIPSITTNLVVVWSFIFSGDMRGILNSLLITTGLIQEPINWLLDPKYMIVCIVIVQLWLSLGASFLSFMAGLQGIDSQMYEAGAIDGIRNRWQELYHITLPSMGPQLLFGAVMQISTTFTIGTVVMQLAGFPSTDYAAETMVTMLIDYGTVRFEMGYACAIATVLFAIMIFINQIIRTVISRISE